MINRIAAESLPPDVPAFLRTPEAINEIEYLGPEPDRWRSRAEPELSAEQAPDHFIDLELADKIGTLPRGRYDFIAALYAYAAAHPAEAAGMRPEKVGFQPWITEEVWQRLKSAMRDYRTLNAAHEDTKPVEAAILFYAGWLGHYVADGSQPLHTTIEYNGWVGPNPNGYTTSHDIHAKFESAFVDAAVNPSDVQPLMSPLKTIGDEWDDYMTYLRHTNSLMEQVYQLDKQHAFDGTGTPDGKQFTAERLARRCSAICMWPRGSRAPTRCLSGTTRTRARRILALQVHPRQPPRMAKPRTRRGAAQEPWQFHPLRSAADGYPRLRSRALRPRSLSERQVEGRDIRASTSSA